MEHSVCPDVLTSEWYKYHPKVNISTTSITHFFFVTSGGRGWHSIRYSESSEMCGAIGCLFVTSPTRNGQTTPSLHKEG